MEGEAPRSSGLRTLFYLILLGIALLAALQYAGVADVVGKSESEQIIDRPHGPR